MDRKKSDTPLDPSKPLNYPKEKVLQIMDEVLLDAVETLMKYSELCKEMQKEGSEKVLEKIEETSEKLHLELLGLERDICLLRGIDIEKYYEDVTFYDTGEDKDVKSRLDTLGKTIEIALKGEPIQVNFEVVPELTKEMTLKLYKLLLTSHLHLHYMTVQKYLKENPNASSDNLADVIENDEEEKLKRR